MRESEIDRVSELVSSLMPFDLFLVMLGSNDLLHGSIAIDVAARMERFLQKVKVEKEKIVLLVPPPMKEGAWVNDSLLVEESHNLAKEYCDFGKTLGIRVVDTDTWMVDLSFDGVHFSEDGHKCFAKNLWLMLNQ